MAMKHEQTLSLLIAGFTGILFGLGLSFSEMINPVRVLGFLDISGNWDPTLLFVMAGALIISIPGFQFARRLQRPVCANQFNAPTKTAIDKPLLGGAALFGIGWGLAGLCPGPAVVNLGTLNPMVFVFVASMAVGMWCFHYFLE